MTDFITLETRALEQDEGYKLVIGAVVPPSLAATAQAFYGTVAVGIATTVLTLGSGSLFAGFGAGGFLVMAALCAVAVPVAWGLRR